MLGRFLKKRTDKHDEAAERLEPGDDLGTYRPDAAKAVSVDVRTTGGNTAAAIQAGNEATVKAWLDQLPEHVRPYRLVDGYPRLGLKMAELWSSPDKFHKYILELVLDQRGGRQGFPADVASDLMRLSSYFEEKLAGLNRSKGHAQPF